MHDGLCEVKLHASAELYWMTVVGAGWAGGCMAWCAWCRGVCSHLGEKS